MAQLPHARSERHLLGFASPHKPLVERFQDRVVTHPHERGHVQRGGARPPQHRREPRNLPLSLLYGATPTIAAASRRSREPKVASNPAHAGHAAQQLFPLPPHRTLPQALRQLAVEVSQLLFEGSQVAVDPASILAVLQSAVRHLDDLPAASDPFTGGKAREPQRRILSSRACLAGRIHEPGAGDDRNLRGIS